MLNTIGDKCFKSDPFMLNSLKLTFQSNDNARILQGRIQMWERLPSLNSQKLIFSPWFCTIQKTTFVTKGHFVIHPLFSRSSFEVYFTSLTVENPQWELTTQYYWNRIPLTLLAGSALEFSWSCAPNIRTRYEINELPFSWWS